MNGLSVIKESMTHALANFVFIPWIQTTKRVPCNSWPSKQLLYYINFIDCSLCSFRINSFSRVSVGKMNS